LSELFDEAETEPVQDEMSAVRILFELFGFLLNRPVARFALTGLQKLPKHLVCDPNRASQHLARCRMPFRDSIYNRKRHFIQNHELRRDAMQRKASAVWKGGLKDGKGTVSSTSGVLSNTPYSFTTRFENTPGTNPEELIAAAHAACFSMALSAQLGSANITPENISTNVTLTMEKQDSGWTITSSHIDVVGSVPGADAATFQKYAEAAEKGCPVSKVLNAKISMNAKLA
jgi:lipoyl-dependent peroxiredoxin